MSRFIRAVGLLAALAGLMMPALRLQAQDDGERRLWDSEFLKKRQSGSTPPPSTPATPAAPAPPSTSATSSPPRTPPVYKRTSPEAPAAERQPGEVLGVTIWRLRPSASSDAQDSRLLIQEDDKSPVAEWTPVRVEAQTTFTAGESVRLSIESPRSGYLYVIDREQYDDGGTSDPYLIFPTERIRSGDNSVAAGKVIELPDRSAFRLKPLRPDYRGELLTMLVTKEPLREVTAGRSARRLDRAVVEEWERQWTTAADRFDMVGGAGKVYTGREKQAGIEGRLLTQDDDLPQTLYHVSGKPGAPLLVSIPLRIAK
jgi:hypothetical protein